MVLPKSLFDEIRFWEHTFKVGPGVQAWDIFTIHFKAWWRPKKVIRIARNCELAENDETFYHSVTPSAADLYAQLNNWAIQTWDEKLDSVKRKYETTDGSNVITLKPRPNKDDND